ncbi:thioredoxin [Tremella mesenterica]|uniref:Thioredoxin n=1 Tax=Tremella mesenterica TaxID=5217 RepID=A0A4Q1BTQ6_TREME|nr:thioredoxin [Tremella mesenterica]
MSLSTISRNLHGLRNIQFTGAEIPRRWTLRTLSTSRPVREHYLDATPETFKSRVKEGTSKPVLVDFYATWCQPCRVLTPLLKNVTSPESGYDLLTLDVDENPELAAENKISALPTVVAFKDGKVVNKFVGFRPEAEIRKFLNML